MRRLAMAAAFGLLAFALLLGPESTSSSGAGVTGSPSSSRSSSTGAGRLRSTALDQARASVPLPRTVAVAPRLEAAAAAAARASRGSRRPPAGGAGGGVWTALARCESGGNPRARSANGRYSGAFQFSDATWRSLGYGGRAADHPYEVQLAAAKRLQARSGWRQWPACARRLGLR